MGRATLHPCIALHPYFSQFHRVSSNTRNSPQGVLSLDLLENLHGPDLGLVIDHDHLQVRVALSEQGFEAIAKQSTSPFSCF